MSLEHSRASVAGEGGGLEPCSDWTVASPRDNSDGSSESTNSNKECLYDVHIFIHSTHNIFIHSIYN